MKDIHYLNINLDRVHWLFNQYNSGFDYLKFGHYRDGFNSLNKGLATKAQEKYIRGQYDIDDPNFLLEDGVPDPKEWFSEPILDAKSSRNDIPTIAIRVMLRAKRAREEFLKHHTDGVVFPTFDTNIGLAECVDQVRSHLDLGDREKYHDVRDRIAESGLLIFTGTAVRRRFSPPPGIKAMILKYDKYPIIIIRDGNYAERHSRGKDLIKLIAWLIFSQKSSIIYENEFHRNHLVNAFCKEFGFKGYYTSSGRYTYWDNLNGVLWFIHGFGYEYCKTGVEAYLDEKISFEYLADTYFRQTDHKKVQALLAYFAIEEDRL